MTIPSSASADNESTRLRVEALARRNREIHEAECLNLNPATNLISDRAEAMLASGLGTRPSLGDPGDKYEMGLEAIEEIELITADLARRVFGASHAEIRVPSGAMANLFAFMATTSPGRSIIVPPPAIGGHVTHQSPGAAGLYGLHIHEAPVDPSTYSIDIDGLANLAREVNPDLITIGQSLNLCEHPVAEVRAIADSVDALVLFDAAHVCGLIAGGVWDNPLDQGAHLMSMSTYKSLRGPAGGLLVTNEEALAARLGEIAYPGMTANFDVSKSAALAITLTEWLDDGPRYATHMVELSRKLASGLAARQVPLFETESGPTSTHQFAALSGRFVSGHEGAKHLRRANLLTCAIGLPVPADPLDPNASGDGVRFGTPELATIGTTVADMDEVAELVARAWFADGDRELATIGEAVQTFRSRFQTQGLSR